MSMNIHIQGTTNIINMFSLQCYMFAGKYNAKSWHDARQYCISQGGNLLSIQSQAEQGNLVP